MSRRRRLEERARQDMGEVLDPTPMEVPGELRRPPTLREQIQACIREEVSRAAQNMGGGSFEEEDDFEEDEVDLPLSGYELADDVIQMRPLTDESEDGSEDAPDPLPAEPENETPDAAASSARQ